MAKYTDFGLRVKIALLKEEMSVPELAEKIGMSRQYLLDILKGARPGKKYKPIIAELLKLEALDRA